MSQKLEEKALPFGIQHTKSRMAELLAADVVVAAGSATLITPAVMIFDRYVQTWRHWMNTDINNLTQTCR